MSNIYALLLCAAVVFAQGSGDEIQETIQQILQNQRALEERVEGLELELKNRHGFSDDPVAFTVLRDGSIGLGVGERIPYNIIITNVGGGWVNGRSEFVTPRSGTYAFQASGYRVGSSSACNMGFYKNEEDLGDMIHSNAASNPSNMITLELNEGDTVSVRIVRSACTIHGQDDYKLNTFSGFFVGERTTQ